jgi:hypothetical protein
MKFAVDEDFINRILSCLHPNLSPISRLNFSGLGYIPLMMPNNNRLP